jgi:hypothetical protein
MCQAHFRVEGYVPERMWKSKRWRARKIPWFDEVLRPRCQETAVGSVIVGLLVGARHTARINDKESKE